MSTRETEAAQAIDREARECAAEEELRANRRAAAYRRRTAADPTTGRFSAQHPSKQYFGAEAAAVA